MIWWFPSGNDTTAVFVRYDTAPILPIDVSGLILRAPRIWAIASYRGRKLSEDRRQQLFAGDCMDRQHEISARKNVCRSPMRSSLWLDLVRHRRETAITLAWGVRRTANSRHVLDPHQFGGVRRRLRNQLAIYENVTSLNCVKLLSAVGFYQIGCITRGVCY